MKGCRIWKGLLLWKAAALGLALVFSQLSLAQEEPAAPPETEQVNVNRADAETIAEVLDGVGLARAQAIVSYRELNGAFTSLEDLSLVSGIGEATLQRNQEKIRFE